MAQRGFPIRALLFKLTGLTLTAGGVNYPDMWAPASIYQVHRALGSRETRQMFTDLIPLSVMLRWQ